MPACQLSVPRAPWRHRRSALSQGISRPRSPLLLCLLCSLPSGAAPPKPYSLSRSLAVAYLVRLPSSAPPPEIASRGSSRPSLPTRISSCGRERSPPRRAPRKTSTRTRFCRPSRRNRADSSPSRPTSYVPGVLIRLSYVRLQLTGA